MEQMQAIPFWCDILCSRGCPAKNHQATTIVHSFGGMAEAGSSSVEGNKGSSEGKSESDGGMRPSISFLDTAADHLTAAIFEDRPEKISKKKVLRLEIGSLEDLMMLRSAQFDTPRPNVQDPKVFMPEAPAEKPLENDPLYRMALERI